MKRLVLVGALAGAIAASTAYAQTTSLGSVTLGKKVMADGKPLAAGTYQLRLTGDAPKPGVGQAPDAEKYVEFVKGGKVVAREVATVISAQDMAQIAKSKRPAANSSKVETLKGDDYVRVWINKGDNNYLVNLPSDAKK
jgi:hypothetical protein